MKAIKITICFNMICFNLAFPFYCPPSSFLYFILVNDAPQWRKGESREDNNKTSRKKMESTQWPHAFVVEYVLLNHRSQHYWQLDRHVDSDGDSNDSDDDYDSNNSGFILNEDEEELGVPLKRKKEKQPKYFFIHQIIMLQCRKGWESIHSLPV